MANQGSGLIYAVRFSVLAKYFGQLCLVIAALTILPLAVSLFDAETSTTFRYAVVIFALAGIGAFLGRIQAPLNVQANEAMVLVAFMFFFTSLVMSFPLTASGLSFSDALFEAVSGITTTGLTTVKNPEDLSPTFLFTRAFMQWYGGLGILVFSLALFFRPGRAAKGLGVTEPKEWDLVGGTKAHARRTLSVYALLSGAGILLLLITGAGPFDALLYTLASVSTGGFAPYAASLGALNNQLVPFSVILVCLAGAIPLSFYPTSFKKGARPKTDVLQLFGILIMGTSASLLLFISLLLIPGAGWIKALHHASILAFSAQTTAGFSIIAPSQLHAASKLLLILTMIVGGGAGSTAGGLKIFRLLVVISVLAVVLRKTCVSKHAVVDPRPTGRRIEPAEIQEALLIILLFTTVTLFSWLIFLLMGYHPLDSLFEVVSATATVGLSSGIVGPELPILLKGILCADMLLGRLEILAWLVMFYPWTWIGRRL